MKNFTKRALPVDQVRRFLEPGPIVLVTSAYMGECNVMTMGWHTVMEFSPSLVGCIIAGSNHSHNLIRRSKECVINIPTTALTDEVIGIGNCSGSDTDKFEKFSLTPQKASKVSAPLIRECYAHVECRLHDGALIEKYNFFIFKVVTARAAVSPRYPETLHYRGDGVFMVSGKHIARPSRFKPDRL